MSKKSKEKSSLGTATGSPNPLDDGPAVGHLPSILTVADVAVLLRLTPKGVYALVEARRISFVRVSNRLRFFRDDVIAWLQENRVPATER
jgi:excisionase family DNA binding protein